MSEYGWHQKWPARDQQDIDGEYPAVLFAALRSLLVAYPLVCLRVLRLLAKKLHGIKPYARFPMCAMAGGVVPVGLITSDGTEDFVRCFSVSRKCSIFSSSSLASLSEGITLSFGRALLHAIKLHQPTEDLQPNGQ